MTAPVMLPDSRAVKVDKPRLLDWGGRLVPPLGGAVQTLMRLGTRHSVEFTIPVMPAEPDGRLWASALRQAKLYGALMWFRQDGLDIGLPALTGTPQVDGAGQYGTTLALKSFRPGYTVREGQAFSLISGGRRYLHFAAALGSADGTGRVALAVFPMLRVTPADGATCEFAKPIIQGSLSGNELAWTRLPANWVDFGAVTLSEDE